MCGARRRQWCLRRSASTSRICCATRSMSNGRKRVHAIRLKRYWKFVGEGTFMAESSTGRVVVAGAIGNVLEWYDFAVYGYFAASIGRAFFPREDAVAEVLAAFGVFAVGFLMRPVGGALIGHIGDRFGRPVALTVSVVAMAV